jgi:hypothetical protein
MRIPLPCSLQAPVKPLTTHPNIKCYPRVEPNTLQRRRIWALSLTTSLALDTSPNGKAFETSTNL